MSDTTEKTSLWSLFIAFCKVGVLTFGGGVAMLPMLEREVVQNHKWTTEEKMLDYYAIGQCTPGIIAVNVATFIGYMQRGVIGGIIATLGVIFPSFLIITALASVLKVFQDNIWVMKAFSGIRIAVCALMLSAVIKLAKKAINNVSTVVIAVVAMILEFLLGVSPVIVVILGLLTGVVIHYSNRNKQEVSV